MKLMIITAGAARVYRNNGDLFRHCCGEVRKKQRCSST
jgi:hypothetical protein